MAKTVGIGYQEFAQMIRNGYFYIDKTSFIREWWERGDAVTLITRPRRFGKTLNMSMTEQFFSLECRELECVFEGLAIWKEKKYRELQGTYPVIALSFANVKEKNYRNAVLRMGQIVTDVYRKNAFLLQGDALSEEEKTEYRKVCMDMPEVVATMAIHKLAGYLWKYYGKKVIILLDEYDTPLQEAYVGGYWEELASFMRSLFNASFKTNPYLEKALMTGVTRISRESIFSDLNNLKTVTVTSNEYGDSFGFTEAEVFAALEEYGMADKKEDVKKWYNGFRFGKWTDIYNPWSVLNFLDTGRLAPYWANTSSNSLVGKLIREGGRAVKESFEGLLRGESLFAPIDEQIVYSQLDNDEYAIWSLLVAGGYLKVQSHEEYDSQEVLKAPQYELALTNLEVALMFRNMVRGWFSGNASDYNDFVKALLEGNLDAMNGYMNRVAETAFSYFDTGRQRGGKGDPELFYHGFVLGLMVELEDKYAIASNRESGYGRYDIMLEPKEPGLDAIIIEFKVFHSAREKTLEDTVRTALNQINERRYEATLRGKGVPEERIRKYGFGFKGKEVLIGDGL